MQETIGNRLKHAWNAFRNREPTNRARQDLGMSYSVDPSRVVLSYANKENTIASALNKIAVDVASVDIKHVKVDEDGNYERTLNTSLNDILTFQANKDQTGRQLIQDAAMSCMDEGDIALVPIDMKMNPSKSTSWIIESVRVASINQYFPDHVEVRVYNDRIGEFEDVIFKKKEVCIIQNPHYATMNESNSTLKQLVNVMNKLDVVNEQSASGKLDLIIQLPYVVRDERMKKKADDRRKDIELQLKGSKYGIAWSDGTEKITQLNRAAENNLLEQAEFLTRMLYDQLGMTEGIFRGTASEAEILNYQNRAIEPLLKAIVEEIRRKWITKTSRTQGKTVMYFKDRFKLVPISQLAEIVDKMTRNAVMTSNEFRSILGLKPSKEKIANELSNKNLNAKDQIVGNDKKENKEEPNEV